MHLTRQADYTMRLLIFLALQPDECATIREVADHYRISRNHLMKVANRAVHAGFIEGVRGRAGGLRLSRPARDINIGQVLRVIEEWNTVECFDKAANQCAVAGGCGLQSILKQAQDAYFAVLDRYSLAHVVRRKALLVQLLGLQVA